ncbi:erythromycin esterase family protein [Streptomyces smyrnaeus]|uniref:erythromycin esterase family protein n=1 Tax=Streptomyces smyrnaeus TaxID=1387713 RepID=UPI003401626E
MSEQQTNGQQHHMGREIGQRVHRLRTFDPRAPLDDLRPLAESLGHDPQVVAVGSSTRAAHELSAVQHRLVRLLVEEHGFRSIALEGDDPARVGLDTYVRTGEGDPRTALAQARPFLRTAEILGLVRWMREYNARNPRDPVRFAGSTPAPGSTPAAAVPTGLAEIERELADTTVRWHAESGDRIVYWGGTAHTAVGRPRTVSPAPAGSDSTHPNAGGYLREHFGAGFVSVGLTFHHGGIPVTVPTPPAEFAESVLGTAGPAAYLWNLRGDAGTDAAPETLRAWLRTPTRTRLVGPVYDPADDAAHHLSGGGLSDWFDALVHVRKVGPVRPL